MEIILTGKTTPHYILVQGHVSTYEFHEKTTIISKLLDKSFSQLLGMLELWRLETPKHSGIECEKWFDGLEI